MHGIQPPSVGEACVDGLRLGRRPPCVEDALAFCRAIYTGTNQKGVARRNPLGITASAPFPKTTSGHFHKSGMECYF